MRWAAAEEPQAGRCRRSWSERVTRVHRVDVWGEYRAEAARQVHRQLGGSTRFDASAWLGSPILRTGCRVSSSAR